MKTNFTTFEVARFCDVFHTTVINWVNKGKLRARTTPGGHRRIAVADLVDFMKKYEMPIPAELLAGARRYVVAEGDEALAGLLNKALKLNAEKTEVALCRDGVEALIKIGSKVPDVLILDMNLSAVDGFRICRALKAEPAMKKVKIIGMSDRTVTKTQKEFLNQHTDAFFKKPLSVDKIATAAAKLASR